jgi:histidine triad (HIT) family protein
MRYDENNIFRKIIDGKIPSNFVAESEYSLVIEDINPQAKYHYLVMPKGKYTNLNDFLRNASAVEKEDFFSLLEEFTNNKGGSRIITNIGSFGKQEIAHLHVHVLRGEKFNN